mmetsp:Transcript_26757/g.62858  ORF Transcript_26757/g.62858 Transcript_26757/m.62858 type:complete len:80 (-) Transcript_26757:196-435(-)
MPSFLVTSTGGQVSDKSSVNVNCDGEHAQMGPSSADASCADAPPEKKDDKTAQVKRSCDMAIILILAFIFEDCCLNKKL